MLLMLAISGSSRIDQQLGKNVAMNIVKELFNKIPYSMFPYDSVQFKEFNPHMPRQEIELLRPSSSRVGCVMRPHNKCVLDDSVPIEERILVPACPLAKHLMMEDIGVASPLYDLAKSLGIRSVYEVPISIVAWSVPYPIGVAWPVIKYGTPSEDAAEEAQKGYIIVAPGGRTKMWLYGKNGGRPYNVSNVSEVATLHSMGPRPIFSTPCRAVRISATSNKVGVLVPFAPVADADADAEASDAYYHPGLSLEAFHAHPLRRIYRAETDSCMMWDPSNSQAADPHSSTTQVTHQWVCNNVLPMCSTVIVEAWAPCMHSLHNHLSVRALCESSAPGTRAQKLKSSNVHVMAKIAPPRDCDSYEREKVWVSIEVRHTVGNLKNMSNADMITMLVDVAAVMLMPSTKEYAVENNNNTLAAHTYTKRMNDRSGEATRGKSKMGRSSSSRRRSDAEEEQLHDVHQAEDDTSGVAAPDAAAHTIRIARFVYANKVP